MTKEIMSTFAFINCGGQVIAQNLDCDEAGPTLQAILKQKAVVLPVTCSAKNSRDAICIYQDKIADNMDILELAGRKESIHVT
ncbi:hypothetical protein [Vibrio hepatarius]|uniref:hypothetical protein n=1 Tax=Vibrio hepatarius TaxID=171383 RepID=UPI001C09AE1E|nr:hypothetical protein [Vibrio hepatarius]MBU2895791.1 hypothetical protein [Vibrio hepatarius]